MPIALSDRFVSQCSPVIGTSYDTCGTITKASIAHLKPSQLDSLFKSGGLFADLDSWFKHSIEMRACGTKTFGWYDWIMANADMSLYTGAYRNDVMKGSTVVKGPNLLRPLVLGRQMTVINREYWKVEDGIDAAGYAAGETAAQAIGDLSDGPLAAKPAGTTAILRVTNRYGMPMDPGWFRVKEVIHVFNRVGGTAKQGNWRVTGTPAVNSTSTYMDVPVASENAASTEPFHDYTANTTNAAGDDVVGLMVPGINNVIDYESWCTNLPNIEGKKLVPFWYQTYRNARCVDAEYESVFTRLSESNEAWRQFGDIDLTERNKQDEEEAQRRFVTAFFFQKKISTNQTLELWESLEAINTVTESGLTPGLGGKIQGRRANWVGVKEQLRECDRIRDLGGAALNLEEFFLMNYQIYRTRKTNMLGAPERGKQRMVIDWFTNSPFRSNFFRAMVDYYKNLYGNALQFNVDIGDQGQETALGMVYDTYKVSHPAAVDIRIISSDFFDDWYDEHVELGMGAAGNLLLALEIGKPSAGSIYYGMLASNRKTYSTAEIEKLAALDSTFRCVMATTSVRQTLTSNTGLVVVECPLRNLWVQNIKQAKPTITPASVPYDDLYESGPYAP